jgi:hypothetical protein
MAFTPGTPIARARRRRGLSLLATCVLAGCLAPAGANAALLTVGSPLAVPATLNTAEDLNYVGTDTQVPASAEAPNGVVHTAHFGSDTALWTTALAQGSAAMPAAGQAVQIRLEGCAVPAAGGPSPLTQIHFQSISPLPGGGAKVNLSSQAFDIPVCGVNGAGGSTVSTYEPINLCVAQGDYVDFNDEGGFVEHSYQSGVPYRVFGAVGGSSFSSFIRGGGTNNGDVFSPTDTSSMDGFATSQGKELMLQVTLGTGPDARYVCPGGSKDAPRLYVPRVHAPITVRPQRDGINHSRVVAVAIYCGLTPQCKGTATLTLPGRSLSIGQTAFSLKGNATGHVPIRVGPQVMRMIRAKHGVSPTLTVVAAGTTVSRRISVKIF